MFRFWKKKKEAAEVISAASTSTSIEEEMGLKEYVSFDSVKAHLVDILEENRKLKQEAKEQKESIYKAQQEERKQKELDYYIYGMKWEQVAERNHYSDRQCKNIRDAAVEKLAAKFQNNDFLREFRKTS